jgi:MGT family glycosyltransferase
MAKALFINGTVHGHLNPTFPVVRELAARGEEVFYFSTADFKAKIEASGAVFMDYGERLGRFLKSYRPGGDHPFFTLIEFLLGQDIAMSQIILDEVEGMRFDYVVHDAMLGGGNIVAGKLGLPAVCSCTSFAADRLPLPPRMLAKGFHPQLDAIYERLDLYAAEHGDAPSLMDIFFQREALNIVFTSRHFQPGGEGFDGSFQFVGPSFDERREDGESLPEQMAGSPLVYISMGTINNDCAVFYRTCMEAFGGDGRTILMSVGSKIDIPSLGAIPENFVVRNHVPQLKALKKASAFISHCGLNSVSEALCCGVPIVAIPRANDQPAVANRLAALGAGLKLEMAEITPNLLKNSVDQVISDESYGAASRIAGASMLAAGGCKAAADRILEYTEKTR